VTWRECFQRSHVRIRRVHPYGIAPPVDVNTALWQLQGKEDDDEADDDARVEPRGKQIVVPHPPTEVVASHEELEKATDNHPRYNVDATGRRNSIGCKQCDGDVDVAPM
jgi:hypothetical protein